MGSKVRLCVCGDRVVGSGIVSIWSVGDRMWDRVIYPWVYVGYFTWSGDGWLVWVWG